MITNFTWRVVDRNVFEVQPMISCDPHVVVLERLDPGLHAAFYKAKEMALFWEFKGKKVEIAHPGSRLYGIPNCSGDKVIVIFPPGHSEFFAPQNAAIYSGDGILLHKLPKPNLTSKIGKEKRSSAMADPLTAEMLWYDHVSWKKDSQGNCVVSIRIGFSRDWFEERILDTSSGTLDECLASGRF